MRRNPLAVGLMVGVLLIGSGILCWKWPFAKKASAVLRANVEELQALPYIQWSDQKGDPKRSGVTNFDRNQASPGYNLYTNDVNLAYLTDLSGQVVHKWFLGKHKECEYAHLLPSGDLLTVCMGQGLVKFDWNSKMIWKQRMFVHHDVEALPDGTLLTIRREFPRLYRGRLVVFDAIQRVSENGELMEKWSTFEHLEEIREWHKPSLLDLPPDQPTNEKFDYYHLNTIKLLPENPYGKRDQRFRAGNLLICLRNVNLIGILDKDTMKLVWGWGIETLDWPHMPTMLPNGNILIFDNGLHRKFSRVLEVNPVTAKIVWNYPQKPSKDFFSGLQSSAQRLPNGNTLICDSAHGHAFEVNREGTIVWDFWNPEMKGGLRKRIYRFLRIPLNSISQAP